MPDEGVGAVGVAGDGGGEAAPVEALLPKVGAELVAIKRVLLRLGVEKSSQCTEILMPGSTVVVLQAQRNRDGQARVRCLHGWVSLRAGSGEALLVPASERPTEAAAPAAEPAPAALPRDVRVGVKNERDAAPPVSVSTAMAEEEGGQLLPPPVGVGETAAAPIAAAPTSPATVAPASPGVMPQKAEPPHPPSSAPATQAQGGADPAELTRLKQQLALAHQELDRLKAASTSSTINSAELAKAAVQLTATAYHGNGNSGSPSLSSVSVPSLVGLDRKGRTGPVPTAGTWQGGMSPFARARRHQAEMMTARQGAWTLGSTAGRSRGELGPLPTSKSPRPTTASPETGWGSPRQANPGNGMSRGQGSYGNGTPRSRSASRFAGDMLDSDPLVLGEARQVSANLPHQCLPLPSYLCPACVLKKNTGADLAVAVIHFVVDQVKIDRWIDEWCVRQGIAGHGGVVRMGLEKAMIEPQDWVTTLRNLS